MKTINDYAELVKEKHALNQTIAPTETNETDASRAYAVGEQLIFNGTLYDVIVPISQHDVITTTGSGANIAPAGPISAKIQTLTNKLADEINNNANNGVKNQLIPNQNLVVNNHASETISAPVGTLVLDKIQSLVLSFKQANAISSIDRNTLLLHPVSGSELYPTNVVSPTINAGYHEGVINNVPAGTYEVRMWSQKPNVDVEYTNFMIRDISITDNTYQAHAKTNRELTVENQTLTNEVDTIVNDLSAKNIFDIEKWLTTVGLAYTKNGDTYTTSTGGQSYGTPFAFADKDIDVTISGIITNVTSDYVRIEVLNASNEVVVTIRENTTSASGKGCKIRLNWSTAGNFSIEKPMIRPASITSDDYVPYAMSNRELTDFATLANRLVSNAVDRIIEESTTPSELTTGVYRFDSSRTTGLWAGYGVIVLTLKNSTPNGVQLAFKIGADSDVSSNFVAYRLGYSNTWSNWAKLSGTNVS